MKVIATGLLLVAAVVYVLTRRWETAGAPGWVGFLRSAAEAAMVGGLADWFAVTALFRRPMGLPIPHTAIIPTRKDELGQSLGDFVGTHFLSEEVVRQRLRQAGVAGRVGGWLAAASHAERVSTELASVLRGALGVLRDEDVQAVLEHAVRHRLTAMPLGPALGGLLGRVVSERAHHRLVDLAATQVHHWLLANRDVVVSAVLRQAPPWSPEFIDRQVAARVYTELVRVAGEVRLDPEHPIRLAVDRFLGGLAKDLCQDPATMERVQQVVAELLSRREVRGAIADVLGAVRQLVLELVDDPQSELRVRVSAGISRFGRRLTTDSELRAKVDHWLEDAAAYVVGNYREELTRTITDTVQRWDAVETSRKIELQVGRDLQFIRINGAVVGALAGLAIHTLTVLAL